MSTVPTSIPALIFRVLRSFGLATMVLTLLLLVTFLGTVEQVEHGLFESQKKYFESMFVPSIDVACVLRAMHVQYQGSFDLPVYILPGGYLLMVLLGINMVLGGLVRLKKDAIWLAKLPLRLITGRFSELTPAPRAVGVFIAHASIVFMLLAGVVSLYFKKDGAMSLREGQTSDEFQSFHDSVIEIEKLSPAPKDGKRTALVIDGSEFIDLSAGKGRTFTHKDLPFELMVKNYEVNCLPRREDPQAGTSRQVVDGFFLQPVKEELEQERNTDGAYVTAKLKDGTQVEGIVWRFAAAPLSIKAGDEVWGVSLNRRSWKLPFSVRLDHFKREVHPGTAKARKFTSEVTVVENGQEMKKIITMNEPLRSRGYALFQQSFDMGQNDDGTMRTSSTLQVVQNPSDHWPLISCIGAGIGLLIHMIWQLVRYLSRQSSKPATV
ncbi:MAG: cytochrome c biogenesis protein ResB [Verrucomicrobiaceae bacterium]|nr:cytochrome c biogenesis protein ResB [Verrucomicrobiaceae bacterium]